MPMQCTGYGVNNSRGKSIVAIEDKREKRGINTMLHKSNKHIKKINTNFGKIARHFFKCFPNEYGGRDFKFSGRSDRILGPIYTSKKGDPETFSFWVNNIFAKKQVLLFFICLQSFVNCSL